MHISENRLEGSLLDTALKEVLDECHAQLVTGTLSINAGSDEAILEIRAGAVDSVDYKGLKKTDALAKLHKIKDGEFALTQKLPDLSGGLGDAASLETKSGEVSIVKLMQHCEDNALSCTISVTSGDDKSEIVYKVGEIDAVTWNGKRDDDRIVDIVKLEDAEIRVAAPPLKFGILSWPAVRDDPTPAFIPLKEMADGRLDPKPPIKSKPRRDPSARVQTASARPEPEPTGGATMLLALFIGLVVIAGALLFGLKALTDG